MFNYEVGGRLKDSEIHGTNFFNFGIALYLTVLWMARSEVECGRLKVWVQTPLRERRARVKEFRDRPVFDRA